MLAVPDPVPYAVETFVEKIPEPWLQQQATSNILPKVEK